MPRVLKNLPTQEEVTALCWRKPGLIAGDILGGISIWPPTVQSEGGVCRLGEPHRYEVHHFAVCSVSSIGMSVISCGLDNAVFMIGPSFPVPRQIAPDIPDPACVLVHESENRLFIGTLSGVVHVLETDRFTNVFSVKLFQSPIVGIEIHPIDHQFFALSEKELVSVDLKNETILKRVLITVDCCTACAVSEDGFSIAISTTEGTTRIVDVTAFREVGSIVFDEVELNAIAGYNYGRHFAVASMDGKVGVFDVRKLVKEQGLKVWTKPIVALAVNQEIGKAAVAGWDNAVTLFDFE
jgi:WD40 repeat protein